MRRVAIVVMAAVVVALGLVAVGSATVLRSEGATSVYLFKGSYAYHGEIDGASYSPKDRIVCNASGLRFEGEFFESGRVQLRFFDRPGFDFQNGGCGAVDEAVPGTGLSMETVGSWDDVSATISVASFAGSALRVCRETVSGDPVCGTASDFSRLRGTLQSTGTVGNSVARYTIDAACVSSECPGAEEESTLPSCKSRKLVLVASGALTDPCQVAGDGTWLMPVSKPTRTTVLTTPRVPGRIAVSEKTKRLRDKVLENCGMAAASTLIEDTASGGAFQDDIQGRALVKFTFTGSLLAACGALLKSIELSACFELSGGADEKEEEEQTRIKKNCRKKLGECRKQDRLRDPDSCILEAAGVRSPQAIQGETLRCRTWSVRLRLEKKGRRWVARVARKGPKFKTKLTCKRTGDGFQFVLKRRGKGTLRAAVGKRLIVTINGLDAARAADPNSAVIYRQRKK